MLCMITLRIVSPSLSIPCDTHDDVVVVVDDDGDERFEFDEKCS